MLTYAGGPVTGFEIVLLLGAAGAVMLVAALWQIVVNWIQRNRGRNWPTVSAVIDIASVTFVKDDFLPLKADANIPYYLATLTYTYRNPELQMGEYSRRFGDEDEARSWADSYKGSTITVHVDPLDPTRSVLRREDL